MALKGPLLLGVFDCQTLSKRFSDSIRLHDVIVTHPHYNWLLYIYYFINIIFIFNKTVDILLRWQRHLLLGVLWGTVWLFVEFRNLLIFGPFLCLIASRRCECLCSCLRRVCVLENISECIILLFRECLICVLVSWISYCFGILRLTVVLNLIANL